MIMKNRQKLTNKIHFKGFSDKKMVWVMVLLGVILCVNLVSAQMEFDNIKSFDKDIGTYGKYYIKDWFGLLDLAEIELKENTDSCSNDCSATKEIILYQEGVLITDIRFLDKNKRKDMGSYVSYQVYIKTGEEQVEVDEFDYDRKTGFTKTGSHYETRDILEEYVLGTIMPIGTYEIILKGSKPSNIVVDWQIKSNGVWTEEWILWGPTIIQDSYTSNNNTSSGIGSVNWLAQSFNASANYNVSKIAGRMWNDGSPPGDLMVGLKAIDVNGKPTGEFLTSGAIVASTVTVTSQETASWYNITMNKSFSTTKGTNYTIIILVPTATSEQIEWRVNSTGGYGNGTSLESINSGGSWTAKVYDLMFKVYGEEKLLQITLNAPANEDVLASNPVTFNCSSTVGGGLTVNNISLWHNATGTFELNQTNSSTTDDDENSIFEVNLLSEQKVLWNCESCDSNNNCKFAENNRTVSVDTTSPVIAVTSPRTQVEFFELGNNLTLNWSINDSNLDSCWFEYNNTNITVTCADNNYSFTPLITIQNLTMYANDTVGNINSNFTEWTYKLLLLNETYTASTISGTTNKFLIELETDGTQVTSGYLNYNNTNLLGSISSSGNYYNLTRNQIATGVSTQTNISFHWNITMDDGTNVITTSKNQTVSPVVINESCGAGMYVIFNFTIVDEITQTKLEGDVENSSVKVDLDLYTSGRTDLINNFYQNFSEINPVAICIDNNLSGGKQYSVDIQIQYGATSYSSEFYNIEKYVLNSNTLSNNITLYDLATTNTQNFRLIARDTSYLPIDGALIQIERKYIDEGSFYITEIPKTDEKGITSASLQLNDVVYNFYIYQEGVLISSFTNVLAICQTPLVKTCEIDFNAFLTEIEIPDYEEGDNFNFTLTYNDTSKIIKSQFVIPSGEPSTVLLEVIKEDVLGTAICSDTLTSASGTLSCVVPSSFGNSTVMAKIYKDGIEQGKGSIKTDQQPSDIFGVVLIMMSVLVIMTLIGIGVSDNPVVTGVFIFVGLILVFSMNLVKNTGFIGATATILFMAIAIILVIIKAARRS